MKFKFIILIFILLWFKIKTFKIDIYKIIPYRVTNNVNADIVICPGGRYGAYQAGICHYIKNNFDIKNKKILGFSAGSINAIFLSIKKEYDNDCLKQLFKIKSNKLPNILKKSLNIVESYNINDYDVKNIYVGTSTINGLVIHNNFITTQDMTSCCIASSFIPYITHNDIFYFYKNQSSIDGGLHYKKYLETIPNSTLVIRFKMFGRYTNINIFNEIFKKNKPNMYELYITGYHDAMKNHDYFKLLLR